MTEFRPSRFEILPAVIKNLLIINGLFFLAQKSLGAGVTPLIAFDDVLALHAWQSDLFRPWQLITHMFLHGDFYHIFGNMFALWMFGSVLENLWGSKRFLTFYMVCGLGAALMHLLFLSYELVPLVNDYAVMARQQGSDAGSFMNAMLNFSVKHKIGLNGELIQTIRSTTVPDTSLAAAVFEQITQGYDNKLNVATLGASGAVFGVLAAFVYLFPNTYIYLYFLIPVKAKWLGLAYFGYEVFFAIQNSAGDNVARWAHIGGAVVGLLIVLTWNRTNKKNFY